MLLPLLAPMTAMAWSNAIPERVAERFTPGKPAAGITYSVAYRFLGLELRKLARAEIIAVEGQWLSPGNASIPACLISFRLDSLEKPRGVGRGVILHNHILAILTFPELDAILYTKRANEDIRIFMHRRSANNYEVYDLDDGTFRYSAHDFLTSSVTTNLVGADDLIRQGKEVCRFLKILYDAYQHPEEYVNKSATENPTFFLYTEGDLVPFNFTMQQRHTPSTILQKRPLCLYLRARPGAKSGGKGRNLELWAMPFSELAACRGQQEIITLSTNTLQWSMAPLVTDLGLSLGWIRGSLTSVELIPMEEVNPRTLASPEI